MQTVGQEGLSPSFINSRGYKKSVDARGNAKSQPADSLKHAAVPVEAADRLALADPLTGKENQNDPN